MGISKIGAVSGLPEGAVRRVAAGYAPQGWAGVSGIFPAGKYLVKSNVACRANFTSAEAVAGYEGAAFSNGDEIIVNVPQQSNFFEYQSILDVTKVVGFSGSAAASSTTYPSTYSYNQQVPSRFGLPIANGIDTAALGTQASLFGYKGAFYVVNSTGTLYQRTSPNAPTFTSLGSISGLAAFAGGGYRTATNGTRVVGPYNGSTTNWYTDNPAVTTGWATGTSPVAYSGGSITFGRDKFIQISNGSTSAAYSFDGVTWTALTLPTSVYGNQNSQGLAYGNGIWVLFSSVATTNYYTSTDGITWTTRTIQYVRNPNSNLYYGWSLAFGNGRFVAVQGNVGNLDTSYTLYHTMYSTDGINWTRQYANINSTSSGVSGVGNLMFTGTTFIWGLNSIGANGGLMTMDGINWVNTQTNQAGNFQSNNATLSLGTRGKAFQYVGSGDTPTWDHWQPNGKFEVYLLDSGYNTYSF